MSRRNAHGPRNAYEEMQVSFEDACATFGCHILGPHTHGAATSLPGAIEQIRAERDILRRRVEERAHDCASVEEERDRLEKSFSELLWRLTDGRLAKTDYTVDVMEHAIDDVYADAYREELETSRAANATLIDLNVKLIEERDRLRRELAERDAVCQAHMEMRYNAERERDEALTQVEYERDQRKLTVMAYDDERSEIRRVLVAFHRQEGDGIVSVKRLAKRLHEASASQADLTPGVPFSAPGVPSSREPLYVYRPMTDAEVKAQVEKNRWGTDE